MKEASALLLLSTLVLVASVNERGFLLFVCSVVEVAEENENGLALVSVFFSFLSVLRFSLNTSLDTVPENLNSGPLISISFSLSLSSFLRFSFFGPNEKTESEIGGLASIVNLGPSALTSSSDEEWELFWTSSTLAGLASFPFVCVGFSIDFTGASKIFFMYNSYLVKRGLKSANGLLRTKSSTLALNWRFNAFSLELLSVVGLLST